MIRRGLAGIRRIAVRLLRDKLFAYQAKGYSAAFRRSIAAFKPDVIQCHDWQTLEIGVEMKCEIGSRLIFDSHELETHRNPPLPQHKRQWIEDYEARLLKNADLVTTVSPVIARYLEQSYGIERPTLIYNAPFVVVKTDRQPVARWGRKAGPGGVRAETKLSQDAILLVVIGNVAKNRGFETIARAMHELPARVHLACVGNVARDFVAEFERLAGERAIEGRVYRLPPVNPSDVVAYIATADIAIVPLVPATLSYELALPNKLFEAAFADLPIIASDTHEVAEMVRAHRLGLTFAAGDAADCARALEEMIRHWTGPGSLRRENHAFRRIFDFAQYSKVFEPYLSPKSPTEN